MRSNRVIIPVLLLIIAILTVSCYLLGRDRLPRLKAAPGERTAVFLTNGQVYFGKMSGENSRYLVLRDVYYLQVAQGTTGDKAVNAKDPQITLIKLGDELHGPTDEMRINREQILYVEGMKDQSKVAEAITQYQKGGSGASSDSSSTGLPVVSPAATK